jgi:hypothetical protein
VELKREGEAFILPILHLLISFLSFFKALDLQAGGWQRRQRQVLPSKVNHMLSLWFSHHSVEGGATVVI